MEVHTSANYPHQMMVFHTISINLAKFSMAVVLTLFLK